MSLKSMALIAIIAVGIFAAIVPSAANQTVSLDQISTCVFQTTMSLPPGQIVGASTSQQGEIFVVITDLNGSYIRTTNCKV